MVDEAHNLVETIEAIHSAEVTGSTLQRACAQLTEYRERYHKRLNCQNLTYIDQILLVLRSLLGFLRKKADAGGARAAAAETTAMMSVIDLGFAANFDNINLFTFWRTWKRARSRRK